MRRTMHVEQEREENSRVLPKASPYQLVPDAIIAERDYRKAVKRYDEAVERYGLRSRQAQVAASDLEAAFAAYGQAAGR